MTMLGKIFTVLITLMSFCFMMCAVQVYMTHRNWRDLALRPATEVKDASTPLGLKHQLKEREEEKAKLERELSDKQDALAREKAARRKAIAVLESRIRQLDRDYAAKVEENRGLEERQRLAIVSLQTAENNLTVLKDENAALRERIILVQKDRDDQVGRVVAITDQIHQDRGNVRRLKERNEQMIADLAKAKKILKAKGIKSLDAPVDQKPPRTSGQITAVSKSGKLVEISIGSDDGISEGHELDVTRGSSYQGRITIRKVTPDKAVGEVLPKYKKGNIQKGDKVATKISS